MYSWVCTNIQCLDVYRQRWKLSLCYFYSCYLVFFPWRAETQCSPLFLSISLRSSSQTHSLLRKERLGDDRRQRWRECDRKRKSREKRGSQVRQVAIINCESQGWVCVCVSLSACGWKLKWQFKRINLSFLALPGVWLTDNMCSCHSVTALWNSTFFHMNQPIDRYIDSQIDR